MGYNLKEAAGSNGSNKSYEPLPSNRYNFKVEKAEHGKAKTSSNFRIELTLQVMDGDYKNRKVWHHLSMSPKALSFITRTLGAMGKKSLLEEENISGDEIAAAMVGQTFSAMAEPKTLPQSGNKVTEVDSTTIQAAEGATSGSASSAPNPQAATAGKTADNELWA